VLIGDARLADGSRVDVRVADGRVEGVGDLPGEPDVEAAGRLLLPGGVDAHVHFREPGHPHKETWSTGSRAAAAGGVTTVVDQPNTDPATTTPAAFDRKARLARRSLVDYGLSAGVTPDWEPTVLDRPVAALGEVFLADSTGDMGVTVEQFRAAAREAARRDVVVTVHAEDATLFDEGAREADDADAWSRYRRAAAERAAVETACEVAEEVGADLHVAHASTPEGIDAARAGGATCEVTPHHALLSRADLAELGSRGRVNPPLRSAERRAAVFERLVDGRVDLVATDHAPHAPEEKDRTVWEAPSGLPGVETVRPLLVALARDGRVGLERVRDLTASAPAERFGLDRKGRVETGADADLVLFERDRRPVRAGDCHSKCGWTPYEGREAVFPRLTLVRGAVAYDARGDRERFGPARGRSVRD
jgi:dihydroorotase